MLCKPLISISILLLLLLPSCGTKSADSKSAFQLLVSDTSVTHSRENELDFSQKMSALLHLPAIDQGVDSFEMRVWVSSMIQPHRMTSVKYAANRWTILKYDYYAGMSNGLHLDSMSAKPLPVPDNIDLLVNAMQASDVLALPSQKAIPNFKDDIADGQFCTIEIATNRYYKALQYHCPEHFANEPNNARFLEIIALLNTYFHFYSPWCKPV